MSATFHAGAAAGTARSRHASDLVLAADLGFVAGVLPVDLGDDRAALPEAVEDQTRKILTNLEAILAPHGMTREHVVSVRVSVVDLMRFEERMDAAYAGFFSAGSLPGRSVAGVSALPRGALVGMDFVVRAPARSA